MGFGTDLGRRKGGLLASGLILTLVVTVLASSGSAGEDASAPLPSKFDRDILASWASPRAIVGFKHDVGASTIDRLARAGITHAVVIDSIDAVGVLGPLSSYTAIARWADVAYVDADGPLRFEMNVAKKDAHVAEVRGGKGLDQRYDGSGVTVAVIDTGIWSHPDLQSRVVANLNFEPAWFMDMIQDGDFSDEIVTGTGNSVDSYGHGTHVAGIVAGTGESAGGDVDLSGVAPGASLANFKIADVHQGLSCAVPCDLGWELNALVAYEYLIEHRNDDVFPGGIRIASNSWSIFEADSDAEPISLIVDHAAKKGIVSVFAAGNDGPGEDSVAVGPNRLESVITVAAACKSEGSCGEGQIAGFSSRGPQVDIAAPGDTIWSTLAPSVDGAIGGHTPPGDASNRAFYVSLSGTSMATPFISGVVALMLEANPDLTVKEVEKILTSTAEDRGEKGFDTAFGHGFVNALKAVHKAEASRSACKRSGGGNVVCVTEVFATSSPQRLL